MRPKVITMQTGIVFLLLLASCAPLNQEPFQINPQIRSNPGYGYSPEDPVGIWGPNSQSTEQKVNSFLSGLRSQDGEEFVVVEKNLIPNPQYKLPRIKLYNIYTNEIINKRKGEFLEVYTLRTSTGKDSIKLYIAPHKKGSNLVPAGLSYASN